MKIFIFFATALTLLSGCGLTDKQVALTKTMIEADKEVKLAIINGTFCDGCNKAKPTEKKPEPKRASNLSRSRLPLPPAEGDGGGPTCFQICNDDCDEQCLKECPDLYAERCMEDDSAFDWGTEEEFDKLSVEPEPEEKEGQVAKNESAGNGNTQLNVQGDSNTITINKPPEKDDPIKSAMATLLKREVRVPDTPFKEAMVQGRGFLNDTTNNAVKLAPAILTGIAINKVGEVMQTGLEEAGPRLENSHNPVDNSDNSVSFAPLEPGE